MKPSDYQTITQAKQYHRKRFSNGLELVNQDELNLLNFIILSQLDIKENLNFIDIGCGTGRIVSTLLKFNPKNIYCLDQSETMLTILNQRYRKEIMAKQVLILYASSNHIPLRKESTSLATSFHLFKHLPDINPTLSEVHRILKKDGLFIFDVLNKNSLVQFNLGTCYALSLSEVTMMLQLSGFELIKAIPIHFLGETIYNIPGAEFIHILDMTLTKLTINLGTKFFIVARKK